MVTVASVRRFLLKHPTDGKHIQCLRTIRKVGGGMVGDVFSPPICHLLLFLFVNYISWLYFLIDIGVNVRNFLRILGVSGARRLEFSVAVFCISIHTYTIFVIFTLRGAQIDQ